MTKDKRVCNRRLLIGPLMSYPTDPQEVNTYNQSIQQSNHKHQPRGLGWTSQDRDRKPHTLILPQAAIERFASD
jgi:hypothetical protein